jgi:hypothetical protein
MCIPLPLLGTGSVKKKVTAAMNTHPTIEDLLDASFSPQFESYQRKVGGKFFPERPDSLRNQFCEERNIHYHMRFETFMVVLVLIILCSLVRGYKRSV